MPTAAAKQTCLVVDDSRVIRGLSRRIMEGLGYSVREAENGEEALAQCQATMPRLILLDWNMPVMTGIEFLTRLRALSAELRPKVVFCTTQSDDATISSGIEAGAAGFVIKPFNEQTLRTALEQVGAL